MKKQFFKATLGYVLLGFSAGFMISCSLGKFPFGIKAAIIVYASGYILSILLSVPSAANVNDFIKKHEEKDTKMFEFESEKT